MSSDIVSELNPENVRVSSLYCYQPHLPSLLHNRVKTSPFHGFFPPMVTTCSFPHSSGPPSDTQQFLIAEESTPKFTLFQQIQDPPFGCLEKEKNGI